MAMLAEPRQRKRYNLVPRGKALYEDDSRFGTKMLEKMGWSKGKGLGAKEDGSKDFVRVRYKNDANGFGYEERDDQWTQHEESFNGLLKSLHGEETANGNDKGNEENDADETFTTVGFGYQSESKPKKQKLKEKFSGESLEEKSKNSKARVHYKKFTRGKDLSRYSEKDLANIFGKKDTGEEGANAIYEQFSTFGVNNDAEEVKKEEEEKKEVGQNFAGVTTINTGLSVSDYFKQKMEALKNKRKNYASKNDEEGKSLEVVEEEASTKSNRESKKKKKKEKTACIEEFEEPNTVDVGKKKKRKHKEEEELLLNTLQQSEQKEMNDMDEEESSQLKCKKKKKKKHQDEETEVIGEDVTFTNNKKKKRKCLHDEQSPLIVEQQEEMKKGASDSKKKRKEEKRKLKELKQNQVDGDQSEIPTVHFEPPQIFDTDFVEQDKKTDKTILKNKASAKIAQLDLNDEQVVIESKAEKLKKSKNRNKENTSSIDDKIPIADEGNHSKLEITPETNECDKKIKFEHTDDASKQKKDVSLDSSPSAFEEVLTLEDLKAQLNSYNIYTISSYCAEKFRKTDLSCFNGSCLSQIVGYSLSDQLQLDVKENKKDEDRILELWSGQGNKYGIFQYYKKYVKQAKKLRTKKKKIPRLDIKVYRKRDVFAGI